MVISLMMYITGNTTRQLRLVTASTGFVVNMQILHEFVHFDGNFFNKIM